MWCSHLFIDTHITGEVLMNRKVRRQMLGKAFLRELGVISLMVAGDTKICFPKVYHCQGFQRYKETSSGVFESKNT